MLVRGSSTAQTSATYCLSRCAVTKEISRARAAVVAHDNGGNTNRLLYIRISFSASSERAFLPEFPPSLIVRARAFSLPALQRRDGTNGSLSLSLSPVAGLIGRGIKTVTEIAFFYFDSYIRALTRFTRFHSARAPDLKYISLARRKRAVQE